MSSTIFAAETIVSHQGWSGAACQLMTTVSDSGSFAIVAGPGERRNAGHR
jgi:hypothetical protein